MRDTSLLHRHWASPWTVSARLRPGRALDIQIDFTAGAALPVRVAARGLPGARHRTGLAPPHSAPAT